MNAKEQKLYEFYIACNEKGYVNMKDETESLKAKVIATDMGIRYRDIEKLYKEAKQVYEAEQRRIEHAQMLQNTHGVLLVVLEDHDSSKNIAVYVRDNGSVYCTHANGKQKYEGLPRLSVSKSGVLVYDYHPSQAVYTGATSGGITMGGVHHTEAYMDEKVSHTSNGYIKAESSGYEITVDSVKLSKFVLDKFRRDSWLRTHLIGNDRIHCHDSYNRANNIYRSSVSSGQGYYMTMTMLSKAADYERLSMGACQDIVDFLRKVFEERYPESDESVYMRALQAESVAKTSKQIMSCIELYDHISDYEDSKARADALRPKYEEVLQLEKEAAILKKEADAVKRKAFAKKAAVVVPIAIAVIALLVTAGKFIKRQVALNNTYKQAEAFFDAGDYVQAWTFFEELDYKDSEERAKESLYLAAEDDINQADYAYAVKKYNSLGEYQDSAAKLEKTYDMWIAAEFSHAENCEFKEAVEGLNEIMALEYKLSTERKNANAETAGNSDEAPAATAIDQYLYVSESEMTPIMKKCKDKLEEVQVLEAEENARLAEEAKRAAITAAYESKDLNVFAKYLGEYTPMTQEELQNIVVGEWDGKSNTGSLIEFIFDAKGNLNYTPPKMKTQSVKYVIESDYLKFNGVNYAMYDFGHGHYLLVNSSNQRVGYLFWREVEETEVTTETTDADVEAEIASAAAK